MARSLNKATLIGNLTRDPELKYTPSGAAVCTFGLATNRQWVTESGEKKEDAEFHKIVAWNKLAEICSQLLTKGRKVYVEGRIQTRSWNAQDGTPRSTTEIVISDMIILDPKGAGGQVSVPPADFDITGEAPTEASEKKTASKKESKKEPEAKEEEPAASEEDEEIPF